MTEYTLVSYDEYCYIGCLLLIRSLEQYAYMCDLKRTLDATVNVSFL